MVGQKAQIKHPLIREIPDRSNDHIELQILSIFFLDKKGFNSFIIMVTWLVVLGGKIKGEGRIIFSSFIFVPEVSLSFTLAESHHNYSVPILLFLKGRIIC